MAVNECIPFLEPGDRWTGHASAAVRGKRFVKISGNRQSGPGLATTTEGGNYLVAEAGAGQEVVGVASYDAAINTKVPVISYGVVPVTAGAAITAGVAVESDAQGRAIPLASGIRVGVAMTAASGAGVDAEIKLD